MSFIEDTPSRINYYKLHYIYWESSPRYFRSVFYEFWRSIEGAEWIHDKVHGKKLLSVDGLENVILKGRRQKTYVKSGNPCQWDMPLLLDILHVLKKQNPQIVLTICDISAFTIANMDYLRSTRNKLAHSSSVNLENEEYNKLREHTVITLTSMGMDKNCIEWESLYTHAQPQSGHYNIHQARVLKTEGNNLFAQGKYKESIKKYSRAIEVEYIPSDILGSLYALRSNAFLELGDLEEAEEDALCCITLYPDDFKGYAVLGKAYEKAGNDSGANLNYGLATLLGRGRYIRNDYKLSVTF